MNRAALKNYTQPGELILNRSACQHPFCFHHNMKTVSYSIGKDFGINLDGDECNGFIFKDEHGGSYALGTPVNSDVGMPTVFDAQLLFSVLSLAQSKNTRILGYVSVYKFLQAIGFDTKTISKHTYERVRESVRKWHKVHIQYTGRVRIPEFDNKEALVNLSISGVFSSIMIGKDSTPNDDFIKKIIRIVINDDFLLLTKPVFYERLSSKQIKSLNSPSAINMYLYLSGWDLLLCEKPLFVDMEKLCMLELGMDISSRPARMRDGITRAIGEINDNPVSENKYKVRFCKGNKVCFTKK